MENRRHSRKAQVECVCALCVKGISLLTTHDCSGVGASSTQQTLQNFPSLSYTHFLSQQVYWFKVVPWIRTNTSSNVKTISGIDPFRDRSLPLSPLATIGGTSWGSQSSPGFKALRQVSDILVLPALTALCPCLPCRQTAAQLERHSQTSLGLARPHCLHSLPMAAVPSQEACRCSLSAADSYLLLRKDGSFKSYFQIGDDQDDQEGVFWA